MSWQWDSNNKATHILSNLSEMPNVILLESSDDIQGLWQSREAVPKWLTDFLERCKLEHNKEY